MTTVRFTVFFLILATLTLAIANDYKHPPTRTDTYDKAIITADADVLDIIDGDTVRVSAHMWPGQQWFGLIRLRGIDTPELRGQCQAETDQAILSCDTLVSLVPPRVRLVNVQSGKFAGRYVADVMDGPRDLAHVLMEEGGRQA